MMLLTTWGGVGIIALIAVLAYEWRWQKSERRQMLTLLKMRELTKELLELGKAIQKDNEEAQAAKVQGESMPWCDYCKAYHHMPADCLSAIRPMLMPKGGPFNMDFVVWVGTAVDVPFPVQEMASIINTYLHLRYPQTADLLSEKNLMFGARYAGPKTLQPAEPPVPKLHDLFHTNFPGCPGCGSTNCRHIGEPATPGYRLFRCVPCKYEWGELVLGKPAPQPLPRHNTPQHSCPQCKEPVLLVAPAAEDGLAIHECPSCHNVWRSPPTVPVEPEQEGVIDESNPAWLASEKEMQEHLDRIAPPPPGLASWEYANPPSLPPYIWRRDANDPDNKLVIRDGTLYANTFAFNVDDQVLITATGADNERIFELHCRIHQISGIPPDAIKIEAAQWGSSRQLWLRLDDISKIQLVEQAAGKPAASVPQSPDIKILPGRILQGSHDVRLVQGDLIKIAGVGRLTPFASATFYYRDLICRLEFVSLNPEAIRVELLTDTDQPKTHLWFYIKDINSVTLEGRPEPTEGYFTPSGRHPSWPALQNIPMEFTQAGSTIRQALRTVEEQRSNYYVKDQRHTRVAPAADQAAQGCGNKAGAEGDRAEGESHPAKAP